MLKATLNPIDTAATGVRVIEITGDRAGICFADFEREHVDPLRPDLAFVSVNADDVGFINEVEGYGYRYAETRVALAHRISAPLSGGASPYVFQEVTSSLDLVGPLDLAGSIFDHDRYTTDPQLGRIVSAERYRRYVMKSFDSPDERVFVMRRVGGCGEVVSFATIRELGGGRIRLLIGGVANKYKGSGVGVVHDTLALRRYYECGYRSLVTSVSAINVPVMNMEIRHFGFRVTGSLVVMRKRYSQ